ncbi:MULTISPECIES: tRNA-dependent cyclodipeptide synthase [Streptomycetaceae]|uniref:Cyclodipeptide synthase n=1 Tax=Streptantibioticus cattleyicolor (strain ATCC 35852 / DSM 46488 / JCM 4925 / NBRC 14057 / NRRL 8057) TaxID=1003195 RepID=F8JRC6_STREN|nr:MULTISPECIES: tRNA-dependent cyclodipeptide synthase [Streptomycetaceae]AEW96626.1 hypothetical protein SCATT_42550 [Streptantibioticus cattleyicolor NRRL 8057 = DSM 46488]MYS61119.1 tRNA-dependent cyclodipeptide synthase [Streptomyces sp. SID5468]CCB76964.1 protein of unknown function [Streptantibioticus cattleyicolor NRRL 8057 = DSM 46488]
MADAAGPDTAVGFGFFPVTHTCRLIWEEGAHLTIPVGPWSPGASADRIAALTCWSARHFGQVDVVRTDLGVEGVLAAFGHDPWDARRRAAALDRAVRATIAQGVREAGAAGRRVRVRALSDFADHHMYRVLCHRVEAALTAEDELRQACDHTVQQFLASRLQDSGPATEDQLRAGRAYLTAELPFLVDTPGLLGVPSSVFCHPVATPLAEVLFGRGSGLRAARDQGYAVVRPARVVRDAA